jgi:hypothetical protein
VTSGRSPRDRDLSISCGDPIIDTNPATLILSFIAEMILAGCGVELQFAVTALCAAREISEKQQTS